MRGRGRGGGWGEGGGSGAREGVVELTQSCFYVSDFFLQVLTISVSSRQVTNVPPRALFTPAHAPGL